jgi:hypothetical protein
MPRNGPAKRKNPNFFQEKHLDCQKTLAESSLNPWYRRAGGDENFRETSIVSTLAALSFRRCFSSPVRANGCSQRP